MQTLTTDISRAAAADAANRQMREAGRVAWSREDYALAVSEFERLEQIRLDARHPIAKRLDRFWVRETA